VPRGRARFRAIITLSAFPRFVYYAQTLSARRPVVGQAIPCTTHSRFHATDTLDVQLDQKLRVIRVKGDYATQYVSLASHDTRHVSYRSVHLYSTSAR
jgi:hypothetical protein